MARHIWGDESGRVYRALITVEFESGKVQQFSYGPYSSVGAAKRQATCEAQYFERWVSTLRIQREIQSAAIVWETMP
jgi:hypothetical protein